MKPIEVKEFTQKHRYETYSIQKKFNITLILHYINGKLNNTSVNCDFMHGDNMFNAYPMYVTNRKKFNDARRTKGYEEAVETLSEIYELDLKKLDPSRIVFNYDSGHVLFDNEGKPIPYLHRFDYTGTPFDNETLILEKAIEILGKHKDVKSVSQIKNIESYNATRECNQYIHVEVFPSSEVYEKFYKKCTRKKNGKIPDFWSCRLGDLVHDGHWPDRGRNYLGLWPDAVRGKK